MRDGNESHIEDQSLVRSDGRTRAGLAIGQLGGNDELPLVTFMHELQGLDPAADEVAGRKARGLAGLGLVEDMTVDRPALVGHRHGVVGRVDLFAMTCGQDLVLESARRSYDAGLLR